MSESDVLNGEDKKTRVRRQPKPDSVLTATFAASRHSTSGTLFDRNQEEGGLLQRQCACGIHTIGGVECDACRRKSALRYEPVGEAKPIPSSALIGSTAVDAEQERNGPIGGTGMAQRTSGVAWDFSRVLAHTIAPSALRYEPVGEAKPTPSSALMGSTAVDAEQERDGPIGGTGMAQHAAHSSVQRACGRAGIGTSVSGCTGLSGNAVGELILFRVNCDDFLSAGERTKVEDFADSMTATDRVKIHGFASMDGPADYNMDLSCARAKKAADVLAGKAIPTSRMELYQHGPTPGAPGNRRSVILERDPPVSRLPVPPGPPVITSATVKAAPSGAANTRTRVGVGEEVEFTGSRVGTWSASIGTPIGLSGPVFRWTAPATSSITTATITLTVGTQSATKTMTVVPPSSISMRKVSSHTGLVGPGGACMLNEVTFNPLDVCLGAIQWLEVPGPATGVSGFFTKFTAATLFHHPNAHYAIVNDSNIMEPGPHNGPHDHCSWHTTPGPYSDGEFRWVVPNRYKLDGEPDSSGRHFTDTTQRFTMNAALFGFVGNMTITKAGAST